MTTVSIQQLATELDMQFVNKDTICGLYHDVPMGVTALSDGFLIQVRFRPSDSDHKSVDWTPTLRRCIDAKAAIIKIESGLAWLEIYQSKLPEAVDVPTVIDEFIDGLNASNITVPNDLHCHYCNTQAPASVVFNAGRVAQICNACARARLEEVRLVTDANRTIWPATLGLGASGAVFSGILWTGLWIGVDFLIERYSGPDGEMKIRIPTALALAAYVIVGTVVGGPTGLFVRFAPRCGGNSARGIGLGMLIVGLCFGELLLSTWLHWMLSNEISVFGGVRTLPIMWFESSFETWIRRLSVALMSAAAVIVITARPKIAMKI